ncbi:MAG: hypothetical protein Q3962_09455, partial [Corynebacterium sp.]|nr:hypothetical protein [Corynebacterium sp.]
MIANIFTTGGIKLIDTRGTEYPSQETTFTDLYFFPQYIFTKPGRGAAGDRIFLQREEGSRPNSHLHVLPRWITPPTTVFLAGNSSTSKLLMVPMLIAPIKLLTHYGNADMRPLLTMATTPATAKRAIATTKRRQSPELLLFPEFPYS